MAIDIDYKGILDARDRLEDYIVRTPLLRVEALDEYLGCEVYIKPENLQKTGSFKLRGAMNSILSLDEEKRKKGVVASSSGNHAQGVACASKILGIDATIVMPENANKVKLENVKNFGAEVLQIGLKSSERDEKVKELEETKGLTQIHPYANKYVKEGQGTIALEILEDNEEIDTIIAPIGGGGLISGVSVGAKNIKEDIKIIGVEPENANRYTLSIYEDKPVKLDSVDTIADGTRTDKANEMNFEIIKTYVDEIINVSDEEIKDAMRLVASKAKLIIEPSSAMVFASYLTKKGTCKKTSKVCFIVSGGNNDLEDFANILLEK